MSWRQLPEEWEALEEALRAVWSSNADAISVLYAGTPALKARAARTLISHTLRHKLHLDLTSGPDQASTLILTYL